MKRPIEADLVTEICTFIASRLCGPNPPEQDPENENIRLGYFWDEATSTWEAAHSTMWKLGLAVSGDPITEEWEIAYKDLDHSVVKGYAYSRFVYPHEVKRKIDFTYYNSELAAPYTHEVGLKDVLKSFTEIAAEYEKILPTNRNAVSEISNPALQPLMNMLAKHELIKRSYDGYFWTDKIAPIMLGHYYWKDYDIIPERVNWDKVNTWLERIDLETITQIPSVIVALYLSPKSNSYREIAWELMTRWNGNKFKPGFKLRGIMNFDEALSLATELLKRFEHKDESITHATKEEYHFDCWKIKQPKIYVVK